MKTKLMVPIGAAMLLGAALPLFADDAANDDRQVRDAAQPHFMQRMPLTGASVKASQILGREIMDGNDHRIGKVRDLAFDLQNGRIVEVIVGTGGFLGFKEKDTAVPPGEFSWNPDSKKLVCQLDPEELRHAPDFDLSQWSASVAPERVREIYHRYNATPYFIDERVSAPPASEVKPATQLTAAGMAAPTVHLGRIEHARSVIGAHVENAQDERVGSVQNVIIDVAASRIVVLIVSTGEYLGMGNEVSAIPAQAFRFQADNNSLELTTSREALWSAPHFKSGQWPGVSTPERIDQAYLAYSIPPYRDMVGSDANAENVRMSMDQGANPADRAISARIRWEIMSRPDLSSDARNVKIITVDGQVTLRGPVRSKEEEETIIRIAKNAVAQNTKVTNQIQTISVSPKHDPAGPDSN